MTPAQVAASKAGEMLDEAAEHVLDTIHVSSCVAIADGWIRLHMALATTSADWSDIFPDREPGQSSG